MAPSTMLKHSLCLLAVAIAAQSAPTDKANGPRNASCRFMPTDPEWPSAKTWNALNKTVHGQLIATVPIAAPCHDSTAPKGGLSRNWPAYDEQKCTELQERWLEPELQYVLQHARSCHSPTDDHSDADPTSLMAPYFMSTQTCSPFQPRSSSCQLGVYSQYVINVTSSADVAAGLKFAQDNNIRLVIHNTGHDFAGKSSGAGSLSLWMHNLKDIEFIHWGDEHYTGKAVRIGAGVQGFEVNAAAHNQGLQVVTGECPTVGVAGGYTQGGGHSALSSRHGMAADQALQYEVVVPSGEVLIANRYRNSDLYWALSGGGGGTYGVVLSLTSKAHPDVPTSGANLTFTSENVDTDVYYGAIETFLSSLPASADAGVMSVFYFTSSSFMIAPLTGPDVKASQLKEFLSPLMQKLEASNITYTSHFEDFDSYLEFYETMFAPIPVVSLPCLQISKHLFIFTNCMSTRASLSTAEPSSPETSP
jgi:hypothetical protein